MFPKTAIALISCLGIIGTSFSQRQIRGFCGIIGDAPIRLIFKENGEYYFTNGSTMKCGYYKQSGDTITTYTYYDIRKNLEDTTIDDFIIRDDFLINVESRFAFPPCDNPYHVIYGPVSEVNIKFPQADTKDTAMKQMLWSLIENMLQSDSIKSLYPAFSPCIYIADYFLLNHATQPPVKIDGRNVLFKPSLQLAESNYIEFEDINVNKLKIYFYIIIHAEKPKKVYVRYEKENGQWILKRFFKS